MGRKPCCDKIGLKRGPWTIEEDHRLMNFILNNGIHCWRIVPKLAGLLRCGKSCRLRWINYLRPDLKRGSFTETEEDQIIQLHSRLGNRWSKIASHFSGRTDNEIKNHWNTRIKKKLKLLGLDPVTHKPIVRKENIVEEKKSDTSRIELNKLGGEDQNCLEAKLTFQELSQANKECSNSEGEEKIHNDIEATNLEDTNDILKNYEMLCGSLDFENWMNQENNNTTTTSSSYNSGSNSFYVQEESYNPSTSESHSISQLVDGVDSLISWDVFKNFEQDLFFFENYTS